LVVADGARRLIKAVEHCWPGPRPPALLCSPPPQPARQAATSASASEGPSGGRAMTPPASATVSSASKR
jgi:hypothetical protein